MIHPPQSIDQESCTSTEQADQDQVHFFNERIERANGSLLALMSDGSVLATNGNITNTAFIQEHAIRIGVAGHQLAICSSTQIQQFTSNHAAAKQLDSAEANPFDGAYFERLQRHTGATGTSDVVWTQQGWCIASSLFSCLAIFDDHHSFVPFWRPPFITSLRPEDRCHLSGVAVIDQRPAVVSCYAASDSAEGWKQSSNKTGVLVSVDNNQIICEGLNCPSSPRYHDERTWFLQQQPSRLMMLDSHSSEAKEIARFPGHASGLTLVDGCAFVGINSENSTKSMVIAVDLDTGKQSQMRLDSKEVVDLQFLPKLINPAIVGASVEMSHWVLPQQQLPREDIDQQVNQLSMTANQLHELGQLDKAADCYQKAISLKPNQANLYNNLGNVYQQGNQKKLAVRCYQQALEYDPQLVASLQNLGYLLREEGKVEECQAVFRRAQDIEPNPIVQLLSATAMPPIYDSTKELEASRNQLIQNVDQLVSSNPKIDVSSLTAPTNFYSTYHGKNDLELQKSFGQLFDAPQPTLKTKSRSDSKIKVGFISRYFRNHTISRLNLGLLEQLPKEKFEVVLISFGNRPDDFVQRFQNAADLFLDLPANLEVARTKIVEQGLDVLIYTDVGMDPFTTTLARSRLAPQQGLTWGHPTTSGMPSMDFFISSEHLETPESEQHYTERLVRLPNVNSYYYRPETPPQRTKSYFGLPDESNIYLCFQNLFKIHPDFDPILRDILERDPAAQIVLMQGRYPHWTDLLQRRLKRTLNSYSDRVVFLPSQSHEDFLALNRLAAVSLDPIHFGGGNTSYEAFAMGLPVVTLPSEFLRCRITYALYQQMQLDSCIANSPREYVEIATQLGSDPEFRNSVSAQILSRSDQIFEDESVVPNFVAQIQSIYQLSNGDS